MISVALLLGLPAVAQNKTKTGKEKNMTAKGTFEVKVIPQNPDDSAGGPFGRMFLDKQFKGDLVGTSKGQMLAAGTAVEGSGGYVAIEIVTGSLNEKKGSFMLQHSGTMKGEAYEMNIIVVPDSGTDELKGITGKFKIIIDKEKHSYEFSYSFDPK